MAQYTQREKADEREGRTKSAVDALISVYMCDDVYEAKQIIHI